MNLVCAGCRHTFAVESDNHLKDEQKHCPKCGSGFVRQTLTSYLRNGPLLDPQCGGQGRPTTFG